jgi:26S proteasome regulatory subunit N11
LINPQLMMLGQEPRQSTSNVGHLKKRSIQALIHGLDRHYYSMCLDYRKNELEEQMLSNLNKKTWTQGLAASKYEKHAKNNLETMTKFGKLAKQYNQRLIDEDGKTAEELIVDNVGKIDPKKHLEHNVEDIMGANILQCLSAMVATVVF